MVRHMLDSALGQLTLSFLFLQGKQSLEGRPRLTMGHEILCGDGVGQAPVSEGKAQK